MNRNRKTVSVDVSLHHSTAGITDNRHSTAG
jgi:hypothetical protein